MQKEHRLPLEIQANLARCQEIRVRQGFVKVGFSYHCFPGYSPSVQHHNMGSGVLM